jgi:hypothetical protein
MEDEAEEEEEEEVEGLQSFYAPHSSGAGGSGGLAAASSAAKDTLHRYVDRVAASVSRKLGTLSPRSAARVRHAAERMGRGAGSDLASAPAAGSLTPAAHTASRTGTLRGQVTGSLAKWRSAYAALRYRPPPPPVPLLGGQHNPSSGLPPAPPPRRDSVGRRGSSSPSDAPPLAPGPAVAPPPVLSEHGAFVPGPLPGSLIVLTARPADYRGWLKRRTLENLALLDLGHVVVLMGSLLRSTSTAAIVAKKYENLAQAMCLQPEAAFVFVGDAGQGDAALASLSLLHHPTQFRAAFIHDVTPDMAVTGDGGYKRAYAAQGVVLFHTYAGAAAAARARGLLDAAAAMRVGEAVVAELLELEAEAEAEREGAASPAAQRARSGSAANEASDGAGAGAGAGPGTPVARQVSAASTASAAASTKAGTTPRAGGGGGSSSANAPGIHPRVYAHAVADLTALGYEASRLPEHWLRIAHEWTVAAALRPARQTSQGSAASSSGTTDAANGCHRSAASASL